MNKNNYSDLKVLVANMSKGEISTAKKFLVAFDSNVTKNKNKGHALFKLLLSKPNLAIEKAKKAVSGDVDERSFDRQVTRLKEKLLESLLLDINISKKGQYSDCYAARMDARKKYMQAYAIVGRGVHKESYRLMGKIIERGKEFELYNELVEALYFLQQSMGLKKGPREFEKYIEEIAFYERCRDATFRAEDYYYRHYIYDVDYKGLPNERVGRLTEYIAELQVEFEVTKSANVGYYFYLLLMEYYLAMDDHQSALSTGMKLVDLVEHNKAIYMPQRLANAYDDIAGIELRLFDFVSAIGHARIAQKLFGGHIHNVQVAQFIEFLGLYYKGELDEADDTVDNLIENTDAEESPFAYDKRRYLKACILFAKKDYKGSYMMLQNVREIEDDKEGWNIGVRLMSIMNLLEMDLNDVADNQTEALRKHIERWRDRGQVQIRKRDEVILKVLKELEKCSYDYKALLNNQRALISELNTNNKECRWEVKTPELIVFQDWLQAKADGRPYAFKLPLTAVEEMNMEKTPAPEIKAKVEV